LAIRKRLLLLSFDPSHSKHNNRLNRLLEGSFTVENQSFVSQKSNVQTSRKIRGFFSIFANFVSLPLIAFMILSTQITTVKFGRIHSTRLLLKMIDDFFLGVDNLPSRVLKFNRTLRQQKTRVEMAISVLDLTEKFAVDCVLLPEDNNYYASGMIIEGLHSMGKKVGVIDFTSGKESEFLQSRDFITPDMNLSSYEKFAELFLVPPVVIRWAATRKFINSFPGSLETQSHRILSPSFESGLADFYLTHTQNEFEYLKKKLSPNSNVTLAEPIEVTLARRLNADKQRNIFGVFLPPNQLSDPKVLARMSRANLGTYSEIIQMILEQAREVCPVDYELVLFPHPRMYFSESELLEKLSRDFHLEDDFSTWLGQIRIALIFSSAVYAPLLATGVRVFNLDLFGYDYANVFPEDHDDFIQISRIAEISDFLDNLLRQQPDSNSVQVTVSEFLESHLSI
jgi:hypothetical protein